MSFWKNFQDYRAYSKLPEEYKRIVFYSEGKTYWPFLKPFVRSLLDGSEERLCYISSEPNDPGLTFAPERMAGLCIGSGFLRSLFFSTLKAKVLAMTMPDLDIYHVKRSQVAPVHYVYLMHGCDSVSMVLREQALDRFDSVFCAGPHNIEEIRKRESMENLPAKNLVQVGYPYQDELIADAAGRTEHFPDGKRPLKVLLAPSWSQDKVGTLETVGLKLVEILLEAGFETTVRPHPQTRKFLPKCVQQIDQKFRDNKLFHMESDTTGKESLLQADLLISDWSAITFEFAFSRLRPVLYIDVPRKAMNPNYEKIGLTPFEVRMRDQLGAVLKPEDIQLAPEKIRELCQDAPAQAEKIKKILHENVYNVGNSANIGAQSLIDLLSGK